MENQQALKSGTYLREGKYQIDRVLGQGGFGITYLAFQVSTGRKVAIKEFFYRDQCNRDSMTNLVTLGTSSSRDMVEAFRKKFFLEAKNISGFSHANIVHIFDYFEENNTAYYVMDYIEGTALSSKMRQQVGIAPDGTPLYKKICITEQDALRIIRQIGAALWEIHDRKITHLDVKPANIMLANDDTAILIDFGSAKNYEVKKNDGTTTPACLSYGYAPMEQYSKGGVSTFSPQSDIYSLGATLYRMLSGRIPPEPTEIISKGLPKLPDWVSERTKNVVYKSMALDKEKRYQTVKEFLDALGEHEELFGVEIVGGSRPVIIDSNTVKPVNGGSTNPVTPRQVNQPVAGGYKPATTGKQPYVPAGGVAPDPGYGLGPGENGGGNSQAWAVLGVFVSVFIIALMVVVMFKQPSSSTGGIDNTEVEDSMAVDTVAIYAPLQ